MAKTGLVGPADGAAVAGAIVEVATAGVRSLTVVQRLVGGFAVADGSSSEEVEENVSPTRRDSRCLDAGISGTSADWGS